MKTIFFALILFISSVNITHASTHFNQNEIFEINGQITYKTRQDFIKAMPDVKYLVLNSKGGIIEHAYMIASLIKTQGIITVIPAGSVCESACTVIFQAGKERLMHNTASLMYHGMRYRKVNMQEYFDACPIYPLPAHCEAKFEGMKQYIKNLTLKYFDTLEKYGVSHKLFERFVKQPIDPHWLQNGNLTAKQNLYINADEALEYNIATEIIE